MKRVLFFLLITISIASCRGPEGPQGYGTNWKIINLTVNANDWSYHSTNGLKGYYSCHFSMPEITSFVYSDGSVVAYLVNNGKQQPLPFVYHNQDADGHLWTETTDFDYSVGGMNIYFTNSDFAAVAPGAMSFRVALMW
jgi:hypothetical protein